MFMIMLILIICVRIFFISFLRFISNYSGIVKMVTKTNDNTKTIIRWFQTTNKIQKRKFYNVEELYSLFREETNLLISRLLFARNTNKCICTLNNEYKLEKIDSRDRTRKFRYIILPIYESGIANIRISSRKKSAQTTRNTFNSQTNPMQSQQTTIQSPSQTPTQILIEKDNSSNNEDTSMIIDTIKNGIFPK